MLEKTICIEFDNIIANPINFTINKDALKYIPKLYKKGFTLYLWTTRIREEYTEALELMNQYNLLNYFTHRVFTYKPDTQFYLDFRGYPGKFNWRKMYKYIIRTTRK